MSQQRILINLLFFIILISLGCRRNFSPPIETKLPDSSSEKKAVITTEVAIVQPDQNPGAVSSSAPALAAKRGQATEPGVTFTVVSDTSKPPTASPDSSSEKKQAFNFCFFPDSLKKAIELELKMNCAAVTLMHLAQIKKLKIQNISQQEADLVNKNYGSYFTVLENLDLSNNTLLLNLPEFVTHIPGLKKLNVSATGISNFGAEMCQLQQLTTLEAADNNYEGWEIPMAVFCLSNLKVLNMSNSSLRYIDEYIYYLKKLEEFHLRGNNLMIAPVVLHIMPALLVLDLRDNNFTYKPVNSLHNCKELADDSDERKECQKKLSESVECEYWYKMPFERGRSFKERYREMTGEPYKERNECLECANCYNSWLNDYVSYYDPDKQYLFDLTINGKTIREWRLAMDKLIVESPRHWVCQYDIKGISWRNGFSSLYHFFMPRNTSYAPTSSETHVERYRSPDWDRPKSCAPINYDTPLPAQPLGPWSEAALRAVQSTIDQLYPSSKGCEHWPTSICKDDFPIEHYYLGTDSRNKPDLVQSLRTTLEMDKTLNEAEIMHKETGK